MHIASARAGVPLGLNGGWRGHGDVQNVLNNAGLKTFCRLYMVVYFAAVLYL